MTPETPVAPETPETPVSEAGMDDSTPRVRGRHRGAVEEAAPEGAAPGSTEAGSGGAHVLPPDASERDAARREELGDPDPALVGEDIRFVTRGVSEEDRAAVVAVLTQARAEESQQVKRVARRDREPWSRSQRVPEGISDLLAEG